ncbi:MAG: hypothetical protein OXT73_07425 [Bacteroidota bacterium]|nr:hypothetical protein [Bacteroidota bacterium]
MLRFSSHETPARRPNRFRTSGLGPLVIHGGTEMLRSKGAAPLMEVVKVSASGELAYHGKRDTYNHRRANQYEWEFAGA